MCLIVASLGQHPEYPLVVAANRDEFFSRPTAAMDWWSQPRVLAGQDLQSGGTWLAISPGGEVAAVTNVREGSVEAGRRSRGELPLLALTETTPNLKQRLANSCDEYSGFNLLRFGTTEGWYYSNRDARPGRQIHRGLYGVSNHQLQTPWPKLLRLRQAVATTLKAHTGNAGSVLHKELIRQLQDQTPAPDDQLPDTGVGIETERFLSPPFISGRDYGTRATTVVTVHRSGEVRVTEQNWLAGAHPGEQRVFCWQRQP